MLAALFKLCLKTGFTLGKKVPTYRNDVPAIILQTKDNILAFLRERRIYSKGFNAVISQMLALY